MDIQRSCLFSLSLSLSLSLSSLSCRYPGSLSTQRCGMFKTPNSETVQIFVSYPHENIATPGHHLSNKGRYLCDLPSTKCRLLHLKVWKLKLIFFSLFTGGKRCGEHFLGFKYLIEPLSRKKGLLTGVL